MVRNDLQERERKCQDPNNLCQLCSPGPLVEYSACIHGHVFNPFALALTV